MATKATYMYQITMGHGNKKEFTTYCYARNSGVAIENMKEIYKDKKYDSFTAKLFGEADILEHPEPFKVMSNKEIAYISKMHLADAPAYSMRKADSNGNSVPLNGEFIPAKGATV